ncbi:helix-turn-helix domain-containing protein [Phytoactinopolyspora endophytica]|uniref:helix-turn-helix domain-containing protein n=1 Tax=Phytoactinopolyspora endophytica TaxID=1642495 RepID=UPI00197C9F06|nr:helix-turn-helix domain-containing protein [Phytoactinopolyspora endophytica]
MRELREKREWSQSELAEHAGVSRSFVADFEAGKPTIEASKLFDVFQALGFEMAFRNLQSGDVHW